MNVVISGPFGLGSLSDEIVLAGLLRHLSKGQHICTVFSADPEATKRQHGCEAVKLPNPNNLLSTPPAWAALEKGHLFLIAGAGPMGFVEKTPTRAWLQALESIKKIGLKTGVVAVGAEAIADPKERVRVQRLLHHFADCISVRDDASKQVLIGYGINANRVSTHGDLAFALSRLGATPAAAPEGKRVAVILAEQLPARRGFSVEGAAPNPALLEASRELVRGLAELGGGVTIIHDATQAAEAFATFAKGDAAGVELLAADGAISKIQDAIAGCQAVVSYSLHGVLLAAATGVPAVSIASEAVGVEKLSAASCAAETGSVFVPATVIEAVRACIAEAEIRRGKIHEQVRILAKKEAHNLNMLEKIVPKRDRYPVAEPRSLRP